MFLTARAHRPLGRLVALSQSELVQVRVRLSTLVCQLLHCIDPNDCLVLQFAAQLMSRDLQLDESLRQQLQSATLTDYDKNSILLSWLTESSRDHIYIQAFIEALDHDQQTTAIKLLFPTEGIICFLRVLHVTFQMLVVLCKYYYSK